MKRFISLCLVFVLLVHTVDARRWIPQIVTAASGPALIAHTAAGGNVSGVTTGNIDTTGSNLLIVSANFYNGIGGAVTITDSKSNTWSALTKQVDADPSASQLFYCYGATVGSGHTFTASGTGVYVSVEVAAFSNIAASPFDVQNGTNANSTTISPGSVTPSQANSLVVTGYGKSGAGGSVSVGSGYTITDANEYTPGSYVGGSLAYKILTASSAQNPTWTSASSITCTATIAVFKY